MSYHNGSIWPHDNAMIAAGLARYGFRREAAIIFEGLFAASVHMDLRRLPELFCGFPRQRNSAPTTYPVACAPQSWATAAPLSLIQCVLGLDFDFESQSIVLNQPVMPDFLEHVRLSNLHIGQGAADVLLQCKAHEVAVQLINRRGKVDVLTVA
jgi:glycogen debranching enzyme